MTTDVQELMADLDAGVFSEKLGKALSDVAAAVIDHNKSGQVTITLNLKRIGSSYQVAIGHKLAFTRPTARGKVSEENATETPMHVGEGGKLTLFPEGQGQMFTKTGAVDTATGEVQ